MIIKLTIAPRLRLRPIELNKALPSVFTRTAALFMYLCYCRPGTDQHIPRNLQRGTLASRPKIWMTM